MKNSTVRSAACGPARKRGGQSARKDGGTACREAPRSDLQRTSLAKATEAARWAMTPPSQGSPRCGNCDASLSLTPAACDLDRPADDEHASGALAASADSDARPREGCGAEPYPGTPACNNDGRDRTKSKCRQLAGNDRKRNRRQSGTPAGGILLFWGVIPQAFRRWAVTCFGVAPAGLPILPPATLLARSRATMMLKRLSAGNAVRKPGSRASQAPLTGGGTINLIK